MLFELKDTPAKLGDLTIFDFYVWNNHGMVQVPKSTGAANSKSRVDADVSAADVSVSGCLDSVESHPDVEMVNAVPEEIPTEPDVTGTDGA